MPEIEEQKRTASPAKIQPILLKYKDRKKKRRSGMEEDEKAQYSRGLKDIQQLEGNILRITKRSANALSQGLDAYERERNNSAEQKKDGALEDFMDNTAKAASVSM